MMKTMTKASLAIIVAATAGLAFTSWNAGALTSSGSGAATVAAGSVSSSDAVGLAFSREEERMARDLYSVYADKYAAAMFSRISASEQRHFDAVGTLIARYSVSDPSVNAKPGVYADAAIQKLYDGWKATGLSSVTAAYRTAVALEKRDIADLDRLQAATTNADLDLVYANLERGSEHHLAAFTAAGNGTTVSGGMTSNSGMAGNGGITGNGEITGTTTHRHGMSGGAGRDGGCMD